MFTLCEDRQINGQFVRHTDCTDRDTDPVRSTDHRTAILTHFVKGDAYEYTASYPCISVEQD